MAVNIRKYAIKINNKYRNKVSDQKKHGLNPCKMGKFSPFIYFRLVLSQPRFFNHYSSLFLFDKRPSTNAPSATPRIVFVFLLNTCFKTKLIFSGRSAKRRMK